MVLGHVGLVRADAQFLDDIFSETVALFEDAAALDDDYQRVTEI